MNKHSKLEFYELIDEDGSIKFKPNEIVFGEDNSQVEMDAFVCELFHDIWS
jgi:hypothetical protein